MTHSESTVSAAEKLTGLLNMNSYQKQLLSEILTLRFGRENRDK